jgi:hypothetical protein
MSEERELALQYRKHSRALRLAAIFDKNAKRSIILKKIASDYDHIASALENSSQSNKAVRKPP